MQIESIIERRLLLNYRLDAAVAASLLPAGLRPRIIGNSALAGSCFIRLGSARPAGIPAALGWRTENAAHRVAVEWDGPSGPAYGVFLPEQFSGSRLASLAGRRGFPSPGRFGTFETRETGHEFNLAMRSSGSFARVHASRGDTWQSELFNSHQAASEFFEASPVGWSAVSGRLRGVRLSTRHWRTSPVDVQELESSFFNALPAGSAIFDHALLMQQIPARWSTRSCEKAANSF